jgi:hypothetical protein
MASLLTPPPGWKPNAAFPQKNRPGAFRINAWSFGGAKTPRQFSPRIECAARIAPFPLLFPIIRSYPQFRRPD